VLVRVLQEPDTKQSNAEAFIESVKESLKEQGQDEEDTIIAANIGDLQQQVAGIEQQVGTGSCNSPETKTRIANRVGGRIS
jgi:hypothetical protein